MWGYAELLIVAFIFSFGGTLIKFSRLMVNPETITFARFFLGIFFLFAILRIQKTKVRWHFLSLLVWVGAISKSIHYLGENYGVSQGFSYGNIIVWPAQTVFLAFASVILFHEKPSKRNLLSILLCVTGIGLISWNGVSLSDYIQNHLFLTCIFLVAAAGSAVFTIVQKKLLSQMSSAEGNLSMFAIASGITLLPIISTGTGYQGVHVSSLLSLLALGAVTGITFLMIADSMKTVPLYLVPVIQSTTVIFSIIWGVLFFHEPITVYIVAGTLVFLIGLVLLKTKNA
ncbi:MAG: DMT family transporter [Lachnospiraceae bacterium]|nr:DMT family transporter [Lachnospiraceae bacterium]